MIGIIGGTGVYDIANKADNEEKKIVENRTHLSELEKKTYL